MLSARQFRHLPHAIRPDRERLSRSSFPGTQPASPLTSHYASGANCPAHPMSFSPVLLLPNRPLCVVSSSDGPPVWDRRRDYLSQPSHSSRPRRPNRRTRCRVITTGSSRLLSFL